jgi:glycine/D-amino acid oxidase-like deaminating enzyme
LQLNQPAWPSAPGPDLPSLDGDISADICVIGLGGSGLTCIAELIGLGRSVVGIDAIGVAAGAAGRNGGLLLSGTSDYHHDAVALLGRTRAMGIHDLTVAEMRRIGEDAPDTVRVTGSWRIAASDDEYADCTAQRDAMRADHIPVEDYDGPLGLGIYIPGDAVFNPLARCRTLASRASSNGAQLFVRTPAIEFDGSLVITPNGRIHCDQVIVAVDGRLESLVPELTGIVRTARLQMLATAATGEVRLPGPISTRYGYDYWQQLPDGSIALGGGRDQALDDEWTFDSTPTQRVQSYLDSVLRRKVGVLAPVTHRWAATVGYTTTGLPVLAEVRPGVWAIGGYSGTGNVMGALCGRAVARLACGEGSDFARLLLTHDSARIN